MNKGKLKKSDEFVAISRVVPKVPYDHRLTPDEIEALVEEFAAEQWEANPNILAQRKLINDDLVRRLFLSALVRWFRKEIARREDRSLRIVK